MELESCDDSATALHMAHCAKEFPDPIKTGKKEIIKKNINALIKLIEIPERNFFGKQK